MAKNTVEFNQEFFEALGTSPKVTKLCTDVAEKVIEEIRATAPEDSGDYKEGFEIRVDRSAHRNTVRVVGTDWKTMLIEAQKGIMARAIQKVKRSG